MTNFSEVFTGQPAYSPLDVRCVGLDGFMATQAELRAEALKQADRKAVQDRIAADLAAIHAAGHIAGIETAA